MVLNCSMLIVGFQNSEQISLDFQYIVLTPLDNRKMVLQGSGIGILEQNEVVGYHFGEI